MKYLTHYIEEERDKTFKKFQAFFAFSDKQLKEGMKENNITDKSILVRLKHGLISPKEHVNDLIKSLADIHAKGIQRDIEENGIQAIIHRELGNHEYQYTYDIEDTMRTLKGYPITIEDVKREAPKFIEKCITNDWM